MEYIHQMDHEDIHYEERRDILDAAVEGSIRRAVCDQCRVRKIRCDKELPCKNCRTGQRTCTFTGTGQKPKEVRQRVLISAQYEQKMDRIDARLAEIERLLKSSTSCPHPEIALPQAPVRDSARFQLSTLPLPTENSLRIRLDEYVAKEDDNLALEANQHVASAAVFATELVGNAIKRVSIDDYTPMMNKALDSLQQIVGMKKFLEGNPQGQCRRMCFPNHEPMPQGGFRELSMPPIAVVVPLLEGLKEKPPAMLTLARPFLIIENFIDYCQRAYFATNEITLEIFIIVNAGLFYLFQESAILGECPADDAEFRSYRKLCQDNLETALSSLNLLVPVGIENIEALLLGASYALEVSMPSIAWALNSTAAQLCLALGWHRLSSISTSHNDPRDVKSALFWFAYTLDKGLALRLGRVSIMQDWDIPMPRHLLGLTIPNPWHVSLTLSVRHAEVQGKVYQQLYSTAALTLPEEERVKCVRNLAEELHQLWREVTTLRETLSQERLAMGSQWLFADFFTTAIEATVLSSLTLVHRGLPWMNHQGGSVSQECIEAARAALRTHQQTMEVLHGNLQMKVMYLHWTVLYSPFIPVIVIFTDVIESSNMEDLQSIAMFVESVQSVRLFSPAIDKLCQLFQMLYNVAAIYVEAKGRQPEDVTTLSMITGFDSHLHDLGFMPAKKDGVNTEAGNKTLHEASHGVQPQDWFRGYRHITGLLEHDLSDFSSLISPTATS